MMNKNDADKVLRETIEYANQKIRRIKKKFRIWLGLVFICMLLCMLLLIRDAAYPRQFYTTNISDYGMYVGNYDNDFPEEFISSFFPEEIEENFFNVKYSYKAQKGDSYAFEAYLEFQIVNKEEFQSYISDKIGNSAVNFKYDSDFKEYVLSDDFQLNDEGSKSIRGAKIGKILYSEKDQRIIYVAIGVYDGGMVTTDFLCKYFDRFAIDPIKYDDLN